MRRLLAELRQGAEPESGELLRVGMQPDLRERGKMNLFQETAISEAVEAEQGLPADLAFVCWREVIELRAMLESNRKDRCELQARVAKLEPKKKCRGCSGTGIMRNGTYPGTGAYVAESKCVQCQGEGKR
jgi:hypothetical protein